MNQRVNGGIYPSYFLLDQPARDIRQDERLVVGDHDGILDAESPVVSVKAAIAHRQHNMDSQRRRGFLAVEEGEPWRQRRFLKIDANTADRRLTRITFS